MARADPDVLVSAARAGDHDAWRQLYLLHARRLVVWLRSLPHADSASSADDLASEAWLTAASKIATFQGNDDDFAGWLFTIARNHASNSRRKAVRRRTDPVAVETTSDQVFGSVEDELSHIDAQATTRALLAHLSPREAQVVACIDVVGMDVAATAAALGMKPTAVRVARHRALGRLRKILVEEESSSHGLDESPSAPVAP
jgi:RNA polymerase sigma-70 factor, ECF subfamily